MASSPAILRPFSKFWCSAMHQNYVHPVSPSSKFHNNPVPSPSERNFINPFRRVLMNTAGKHLVTPRPPRLTSPFSLQTTTRTHTLTMGPSPCSPLSPRDNTALYAEVQPSNNSQSNFCDRLTRSASVSKTTYFFNFALINTLGSPTVVWVPS